MSELHKRKYPYPEDCIYLVTGGEATGGEIKVDGLVSLIIVARSEERAKRDWGFRFNSRGTGVPMACLAMPNLRKFVDALRDAERNPDGYLKIPKAFRNETVIAERSPWVVVFLDDSKREATGSLIVMARDADDILYWARSNKHVVSAVVSLSIAEATLAEMEKVKNGTAEIEYFATEKQDLIESLEELLVPGNERFEKLMAEVRESNRFYEQRKKESESE